MVPNGCGKLCLTKKAPSRQMHGRVEIISKLKSYGRTIQLGKLRTFS
jgi:hypothetical protein